MKPDLHLVASNDTPAVAIETLTLRYVDGRLEAMHNGKPCTVAELICSMVMMASRHGLGGPGAALRTLSIDELSASHGVPESDGGLRI